MVEALIELDVFTECAVLLGTIESWNGSMRESSFLNAAVRL